MKNLFVILTILIVISGCVSDNDVKNAKNILIGNSYHCELTLDKEVDIKNYQLEFINDSVLIMTFKGREEGNEVHYIQSDRWNLEKGFFNLKITLESAIDKKTATLKLIDNGAKFEAVVDDATIIGEKLTNEKINNRNSLIGKWKFLEFGFPGGFDTISGEMKTIFPTYIFNKDSTFYIDIYGRRRSKGKWSLNYNNSLILLNGGLENNDILRIIELKEDILMLNHRNHQGEMIITKLTRN